MISVAGEVSISRRYYACRHCRQTAMPWDDWAGLENDHLTAQARRLAVLAGSSWSFDQASARLREFCGLRLSDAVIRKVTNEAGRRAAQWQRQSKPADVSFQQADGHSEFYTDGTSVNTRKGWREIRLGIFAKRPAGPPVGPEKWSRRVLPPTTARVAFSGITSSDEFGPQWAAMARRLGLSRGEDTSILADGAKWIWKQTAQHLPRGECVVDVFHVSEHLHECGRALHGEGRHEARNWADQRLAELLDRGPVQFLSALQREERLYRGGKRRALRKLAQYLRPNVDGLWYRSRLGRGLAIGSGLVEGACKNVIGRRLKLNAARWHVDRAEHVAALCCLHYSQQWEEFWKPKVA